MDSGATHHMVQTTGNLDNPTLFKGSDSVMVGDGKRLQITHVGNKEIGTNLRLKDVLVVPKLKKKLLSVSKLASDNECLLEFTDSEFVVKDKKTRNLLAKGSRKGDLYALDAKCAYGKVHQALATIRSSKASDEEFIDAKTIVGEDDTSEAIAPPIQAADSDHHDSLPITDTHDLAATAYDHSAVSTHATHQDPLSTIDAKEVATTINDNCDASPSSLRTITAKKISAGPCNDTEHAKLQSPSYEHTPSAAWEDPPGIDLCVDSSKYQCLPTTSSSSPDNTYHMITRTKSKNM
ncbi:hypothetical protein KY290_038324 [Solanum tuberosum]|uniref:Retrovirus-related Pol polyprotein from transposon TNT 1-94-like beta-barrel domain-containing protein n=1 Tax=Solanum tuberosum TaxID=4113 RepID=A0ABQ7TZB8_SOLTU|nr:hypothetical protein KY289_036080 [Solanum tuberosum]KAH0639326.1 hypothetical protein KY285_035912 [Solanum tuberosum]KAH0739619.1 hypothetical protein KY290_038324 [Solanum tuberosum]